MYSPEQYAALREGAGLVDRTASHGRLAVTGGDRRTYLQGLLTNDILALTPGTGCYAAYLTPQGRMISDLRVFETGERILITLPASRAAIVASKLSEFIFAEDVAVGDVGGSTAQIGVYGPRAGSIIASLETANADVTIVPSDDLGVTGFDIVMPRNDDGKVRDILLQSGAVAVDAATAETRRIEAGRPLFGADMDEDTIPLEAGIEDRAISLTKGCYVGQEIVIRVLHRGHGRVARRLVGLTFAEDAPVASHDDVVRANDREAGRVTSAEFSPALKRPIALGYVHRDLAAPGAAVTVMHAGQPLAARIAALPFV